MPSKTEKQHRAMEAAAHGHSTLGIPKSVGKEFVAADSEPPTGIAAGTAYVTPFGKVLLLRRSDQEENYPGHWALPGGKADDGETAQDAAEREDAEELGNEAPKGVKRKLMRKVRTPGGFDFHTFAAPVEKEFWPRINSEHSGAGWFGLDELPRPIHPAVRETLGDHLAHGVAEDMEPDDWEALRDNFVKWTREEEEEPEHAEDAVHAPCKGSGCKACGWTGVANTNYWPMKPKLGAPSYSGAQDTPWDEGKHPRGGNGQFGQGGGGGAGGSSESAGSSPKPALKMSHLSKKGGKLGSNEGGLYEGPKGDKFYIKKPATKAHVDNERAAAKLYQLAGAQTLDYRDVAGGEHVATEWQQLEKKNISEFTPAERKEAAKDFAIHCWLANWDAAGTGGDNQGVLNGKTTTLDVGGSLRYRAQGGPKGESFGAKVSEFDTMRDKGMSPDAARLFAPMKEKELKASVERVTSIDDDKIRAAVGDDKALADTLIARKKDLAKRVGIAMDEEVDDEEEDEIDRILRETLEQLELDGETEAMGEDEAMAFDRAPPWLQLTGDFREGLAFDKQSVRSYSKDGHLHVEEANISKACVNPYIGKEIPKWRELGLQPNKVYKLLRHPEELKKGAGTFDGKPILSEHVPVTSDAHRPDLTVGSTGTGTRFEHPYLKSPLVFWTQDDIDDIETKRKKELSSAYHYRADMTPGNFEGEDYDGVMRDIVGNHVAHVKEGRAGSDVVVGDSKNPLTDEDDMSKVTSYLISKRATAAHGALLVHMTPLIAKDAKINFERAFKDVTAKNFAKAKPVIINRIVKLTEGKLLAADSSIKEGLESLLAMIEGAPMQGQDEFPVPEKKEPEKKKPVAEDDDMDDEDMGEDEEDDDLLKKKKVVAEDADEEDEIDGEEKDDVGEAEDNKSLKAMDVKLAVDAAIVLERKKQQGVNAAREHVRARVGVISIACDSAKDVYLQAIKMAGKDPKAFKGANARTLRGVFDMIPAAGVGARKTTTSIAQDAAPSGGLSIATTNPNLVKNLARIGG